MLDRTFVASTFRNALRHTFHFMILAAVGNQFHVAAPDQGEFEADQLPDKSPQGRAFRIHPLFVPNGKDRLLVGTTSNIATSGSSCCEGLDVFFSHFCLSE